MTTIYKITNLLNQKLYIGRTSAQDPNRRWTEHKSKAKLRPQTPIERAVAKYGSENFLFEPIDKCEDEKAGEVESSYIKKFNTMAPIGYNLEFYHPFCVRSKETLLKMSKSQQGIGTTSDKTSKYLGVYKSKNSFPSEIAFQKRKYKKYFNSEIKAAIAYDKMALFLYGEGAKLNFPTKKDKWLRQNLQKFFNRFTIKKYSSNYFGVVWHEEKNRWRAILCDPEGTSRYVKTELEAAILVDKAAFYYKLNKRRNFPDKTYKESELDCLKRDVKPKSSKYIGVSFVKRTGKYTSNLEQDNRKYFCGNFDTEEEARQARQDKIEEIIKFGPKDVVKKHFKFKGVSKTKNGDKFYAKKTINDKEISSRFFNTEREAAEAYDVFTVKGGKEFRTLNFPEKIEFYQNCLIENYLPHKKTNGLPNKIYFKANGYEVCVRKDGKTLYIGRTKTLEEAIKLQNDNK